MENRDLLQSVDTGGDVWKPLKAYTNARIALGRTGVAVPLEAALAFKLAHAHARDAVYSRLDLEGLRAGLKGLGVSSFYLSSRANDRLTYLQRPDLGRRLNEDSAKELEGMESRGFDVAIVVADGLSATAINHHAVGFLEVLMRGLGQYRMSPIVIVEQGRVAIGDEVGALLKATLVVVLIGERPGLSSAESMGVYMTYQPRVGMTDEARNCISNIHGMGLGYAEAARTLHYLIEQSMRLQLSGVGLKVDLPKNHLTV